LTIRVVNDFRRMMASMSIVSADGHDIPVARLLKNFGSAADKLEVQSINQKNLELAKKRKERLKEKKAQLVQLKTRLKQTEAALEKLRRINGLKRKQVFALRTQVKHMWGKYGKWRPRRIPQTKRATMTSAHSLMNTVSTLAGDKGTCAKNKKKT
jgi:hypothetical protein